MYGGGIVFWFGQNFCFLIAEFTKLPGFVLSYTWAFFSFFSLILVLICLFIAVNFPKFVKSANKILTIFALTLTGLLLLNVAWQILYQTESENNLYKKSNLSNGMRYPNVYHILLDAHPNQKAMEIIGGDLKPFYDELESLGFVTFPESRSNYPATARSVASMLNMDYLRENIKPAPRVFTYFTQHNYNVKVVLQSNILKKIYHYYGDIVASGNFYSILYTFFSRTFLKHYYEDFFQEPFKQGVIGQLKAIAQTLSSGKTNYGSANNLFYSHFICPHEPCIFNKKAPKNLGFSGFLKKQDKSYQLNPEAHKLLCENIYGIDDLILETIKAILKQYEPETIKPIIVLHSDHSILNDSKGIKHPFITPDTVYGNLLALYVPDEWKQDAKDLKFINLYRWIFNHLFGDNFEYFKENEQK